jgi:hypothetical protein
MSRTSPVGHNRLYVLVSELAQEAAYGGKTASAGGICPGNWGVALESLTGPAKH